MSGTESVPPSGVIEVHRQVLSRRARGDGNRYLAGFAENLEWLPVREQQCNMVREPVHSLPDLLVDLRLGTSASGAGGVAQFDIGSSAIEIGVELCELHLVVRVVWGHLADPTERDHHVCVVGPQHGGHVLDVGNLLEELSLGIDSKL